MNSVDRNIERARIVLTAADETFDRLRVAISKLVERAVIGAGPDARGEILDAHAAVLSELWELSGARDEALEKLAAKN